MNNLTSKQSLQRGYQISRKFLRAAYQSVRVELLGQRFPLKPQTLNLLVNDICNSRCQMCNIWMQKRNNELSPKEFAEILDDPLFTNVRYVGVSGGEPTLRNDLPEIFEVLVKKSPRILGVGIITNAIRENQVIGRISRAAVICSKAGLPFNIMVSLDGIGPIHDRIRGRSGNFDSAMSVIRYFQDHTVIPLSIGCTITKENVWNIDDVLDYCRNEGIYGRFRIADFINRLYNLQQTEYIRNFTQEEKLHLGLFFAKLEYTYEPDPVIRKTYANIRMMLMDDTERKIGCPYQVNAITMDCRGNLLYCSPKSPTLGNTGFHSAQSIYLENIPIRKKILQNNCKDCIHDYHAPLITRDFLEKASDRYFRKCLSIRTANCAANWIKTQKKPLSASNNIQKILIVGWYGTETAGDKAILDGILNRIFIDFDNASITVASLYPYLTQWTIKELGYSNITVIPTYSKQFWQDSAKSDLVIMGGGPLMHIEELGTVLWSFIRAKHADHHTWLAGCGIGPLDKGEPYTTSVYHILRLADTIELRDKASIIAAKRYDQKKATCSGDYAESYVRRWAKESCQIKKLPFLNLFLRDWPNEYKGSLSEKQFSVTKSQFEENLALLIRNICSQHQLHPRLIPMHYFCIGNDDRDFNRRFSKKYLNDLSPIVEYRPIALKNILHFVIEGKFSICMRFHSVLFAKTLGVPFLAIDYTNGGKIAGYLQDYNSLENLVGLQNLANGNWNKVLELISRMLQTQICSHE